MWILWYVYNIQFLFLPTGGWFHPILNWESEPRYPQVSVLELSAANTRTGNKSWNTTAVHTHTHTHKLVNTGKRGPPIVPLLFATPLICFVHVWQTGRLDAALWGLSIVLSFVLLLPNTPWLCARKCYGDIKMPPQLRWSHTLTQLWGHPCPHNSATARAQTHTHNSTLSCFTDSVDILLFSCS